MDMTIKEDTAEEIGSSGLIKIKSLFISVKTNLQIANMRQEVNYQDQIRKLKCQPTKNSTTTSKEKYLEPKHGSTQRFFLYSFT